MLCMISLVIEFNVLSISSPNIFLAVVKEKATAVGNDFQGLAQSRCEAFLKSEKSAYKSIFDAEIYSCPFDGLRQNARKR